MEIELENITKSFNDGKIIAVNEVNLKLRDRDYIFILGPSGCGKTTLLKIISGLLTPTSGDVYINATEEEEVNMLVAFSRKMDNCLRKMDLIAGCFSNILVCLRCYLLPYSC